MTEKLHNEEALRTLVIEACGLLKLLDRKGRHPSVTDYLQRAATFLSPRQATMTAAHSTHCRAYGNWQPPYEDCTCGADDDEKNND